MKTRKFQLPFLILTFLIFSVSSYSQSINFVFDYSPNFSNFINHTDRDSKPKLSHNLSLKSNLPIASAVSLSAGLGYYNIGYKYSSESTSFPIGSTLTETTNIFNYNYFVVNIGSRFHSNKYFVAPEFGLGFLMESSTKRISTNQTGGKNVKKTRSKTDKIDLSMIPFSLSVGRTITMYDLDVILGIKGYYAFFNNDINQEKDIKAFGIGLLLGIQFD